MSDRASRAKRWIGSFKDRISARYPVRLHMTLILLLVTLSGMGASMVMMHMGVKTMWIRYGGAVLISYGVFLVSIRFWLWYVLLRNRRSAADRSSGGDGLSLDGDVSLAGIPLPSDAGDSVESAGEVVGGGGSSGGGGASTSWAGGAGDVRPVTFAGANAVASDSGDSGSASPSSSGGSSGIGSLFDGLDGDAVVFILIAALVLALSGVWIYLIYQAPVILSEVAFQFLLASGLMRKARSASVEGWVLSTLRGTWIPLLIIVVLAVVLGYAAQEVCPAAVKLRDVFGPVCQGN